MPTTYYQYTILQKIKFGFAVFFRCMNCFHNLYERFQFLWGLVQTCSDTIPYITCPYCGDRVYILESEPGTYQLCIEVDQSTLVTTTLRIAGTNGYDITILWGDNTLSTGTMTGSTVYYTHDYDTEDTYYIKILVDASQITEMKLDRQTFTGTFPDISDFTSLLNLYLFQNEFSGTFPDISSLTQLYDIRINQNQFTGNCPDISGMTGLYRFSCVENQFSGAFPSVASLTALVYLQFGDNQFTGSVPDISNCTLLDRINAHINQFTGSVPAFGANTALRIARYHDNQLSGTFPSVTSLTALESVEIEDNQFTGWTTSTIALSCTTFTAQNNLLTQAAVDAILFDFYTNLASRPGSGTINLGGTGNAAPSATGQTYKAAIIAHGWTVTTN